jgi:hypothetical protein
MLKNDYLKMLASVKFKNQVYTMNNDF